MRRQFFGLIALVFVFVVSPSFAQDITLLGGDLTSSFQDRNAIQLPAPNVTDEGRRQQQLSGFGVFHGSFTGKTGLGPRFNHTSCGGCHVNNGRGKVALSATSSVTTMVIKVARRGLRADGSPRNVPGVGEQLQDHTTSEGNLYSLRLGWEAVRKRYADGSRYTLRRPVLRFRIPRVDQRKIVSSLRMTPPIIGPGLLEAIPESTILAMSDPFDLDGDGISGKPQYVINQRTGQLQLGRFGFKASHPTVEQQSAAAAFFDIGITNILFPFQRNAREITDVELREMDVYLRLAGVPAARNQDNPTVIRGKQLFQQIGCDACHKMTLVTGPSDLPELENQVIHPFTDLLLHDMGSGLADKRAEFQAKGSEWRTTPLWGLGFSQNLSKVRTRYLHDGRARTLQEAILWHGGEGAASRSAFKALSKEDRDALIEFLRSL